MVCTKIVQWASFATSIMLLVGLPATVMAQSSPSSSDLRRTISDLDRQYFDAYNRCDLEALHDFHSSELEAFHDVGGGPTGRAEMEEQLAQNICSGSQRVRREIVPGTLEVYALNEVGAMELADHRFYQIDASGSEELTTLAKVIIIWRRVGNEWKAFRVISYDHRPADG